MPRGGSNPSLTATLSGAGNVYLLNDLLRITVERFWQVLPPDYLLSYCEVLKLADMPSCLGGGDHMINERYGLTTKFRSSEFAFWLSALWRFESFSHSFFYNLVLVILVDKIKEQQVKHPLFFFMLFFRLSVDATWHNTTLFLPVSFRDFLFL